MKFVVSVILFLSLFQLGGAQTEYKISTEGYTFEKPVGRTVILKIYLSISNTGAVEEFPGEVKKIKLKSSNYEFDKDIFFVDYKKIIGNSESLTNFSVYALSFLVPIDASNIKIVFPERYGGLAIDVTKKNYNEWSESNSPENTSRREKPKTILPHFTKYVGVSIALDIGITENSTQSSKSRLTGSLGFEILPRLYNFGKENKSAIFGTVNFHWGGIEKGNADGLNNFYRPDSNYYKIIDKEKSDSSFVNYISYGGGLGVFVYLGKINPMISISYINTKIIPHKMQVKNASSNNSLSDLPSYDGWGFKIDAGIQLFDGMLIAYTFRQFDIKSGYSFLTKQHNMHLFKLAIWGWSY